MDAEGGGGVVDGFAGVAPVGHLLYVFGDALYFQLLGVYDLHYGLESGGESLHLVA